MAFPYRFGLALHLNPVDAQASSTDSIRGFHPPTALRSGRNHPT
jgi:hypothetical protein